MRAESNTVAMSEPPEPTIVRELSDDELQAASGGLVVLAIIMPLIGLLLPAID
jgi:hypothetical protein